MRCAARDSVIIPSYTDEVKTAISLPDPLFERAEQHAAAHGLGRSQLYATALERYLDAIDADQSSEHIDRALQAAGYRVDGAVGRAGLERLAALTEGDDW